MNVLVLGLYAEGRSDERFLPLVIRRTAERLLAKHGRNIEPMEPIVVRLEKDRHTSSRAECILEAARQASKYDALIIHSDADYPTAEKARIERFEPGYRLVQQMIIKENICRELIPIIPVRMVETWMLADPEALSLVLQANVHMYAYDLLKKKAKQVESYGNPKDVIDQIIRRVCHNQPQQWNRIRAVLYADLAPIISLEQLDQVPAYQQFVKDLTDTLKKLNFIQ